MRLQHAMESAGYETQGEERGDVGGRDDLEEELGGEVLEHFGFPAGGALEGFGGSSLADGNWRDSNGK